MTISQSAPPTLKKARPSPAADRARRSKNDSYHQCFQKYFHSYQYLKPDPVYVAGVGAVAKHWQLRDVIKYDQASNGVLYTRNDAIHRLDLARPSSKPYVSLSYCPCSFDHTDDGAVVTGGLMISSSDVYANNIETLRSPSGAYGAGSSIPKKGLFSFANPATGASKTVRFGEMINNDVTLYRTAGSSYQSFVCNNDSNLYCLDIANNDTISISRKINCEVNTCLNTVLRNPVNHKLLTVTGDSSSIFLVDHTSASSNIKTIKTGHNAGFGVSYHPNGYLFSSVFEDGTCLLYDLRNIRDNSPLMTIKSTRPGHQSGAFRASKFSPENDMSDLLVISEHVGRVHLVDLRRASDSTANEHQVIVVPFALDQFGEYKGMVTADGPVDTDRHSLTPRALDVYSDRSDPAQNLSFTAPLVYDYDYLVNQNPHLFKEFFYTPPPPPPPTERSPPKFHIPEWSSQGDSSAAPNNAVSPTSSQRSSFSHADPAVDCDDMNPDIDAHLQYVYDNLDYTNPSGPANAMAAAGATRSRNSRTTDYNHYSNYCEEMYQQSINHIHGEMELAGVTFCNPTNENDSKVLIGCHDGGVLMFDVNGIARRSFGTFEYM